MKPFNLKEALSGKTVLTRDGEEVTNIVKFDNVNHPFNLAGVLHGRIQTWTEKGEFNIYSESELNDFDLFMASEETAIWINIWKNSQGIMFCTNWSREDKADKEIEEELNFIHLKKIRITL